MLNTRRRRTLCSHTHWYQRLCMQIFRWRLSVSSFLKMKAPHTSFSTITTFHDQLMGRKECTRYSSLKTHKSLPFSKYMSFNAPPYDFFFYNIVFKSRGNELRELPSVTKVVVIQAGWSLPPRLTRCEPPPPSTTPKS